jgi:two-component system CheB/CheR fusion protein
MEIERYVSRPPSAGDAPLIVAVACFAGDIAAPSELVSALSADCRAAFIFVQQLSGRRETHTPLAAALTRNTTLPVLNVQVGLRAEPGSLYVIAPDVTTTMTGARICLTPGARGIECPSDVLFTSLAQELGDAAIGVILSGGGSEGALGIRAIKHAGGITFAQYPGSARFPNTPISAIDSGCVDFVLRPNEIAHHLTRISRKKQRVAQELLGHTQLTQLEPIPRVAGAEV